jgi:hypothetical protein
MLKGFSKMEMEVINNFIFNLGLQFLGMNFMVPSNEGSAVGLEK